MSAIQSEKLRLAGAGPLTRFCLAALQECELGTQRLLHLFCRFCGARRGLMSEMGDAQQSGYTVFDFCSVKAARLDAVEQPISFSSPLTVSSSILRRLPGALNALRKWQGRHQASAQRSATARADQRSTITGPEAGLALRDPEQVCGLPVLAAGHSRPGRAAAE